MDCEMREWLEGVCACCSCPAGVYDDSRCTTCPYVRTLSNSASLRSD